MPGETSAGTVGFNHFVVLCLAELRDVNGAVWGVVLGTTYLVWFYYRVAMGQTNPLLEGLKLELNAREIATLAPLALLALALGLNPELVLSYLHAPVADLLAGVTP